MHLEEREEFVRNDPVMFEMVHCLKGRMRIIILIPRYIFPTRFHLQSNQKYIDLVKGHFLEDVQYVSEVSLLSFLHHRVKFY
jgi:hypothetical protein